jgi:hypothetical protein
MGHDPLCSICASSSPEEAALSKAYEEAFTRGFRRAAEAVAEWLEGAQWDAQGQPTKRDPLPVDDEGAKVVAQRIRERFAHPGSPGPSRGGSTKL